LKLVAPPPIADRAREESSDSLAQPKASLQARDSSTHALRRSLRIENKKGEKNCFSSGSLREKNAVKTQNSPGSLPLHRPAVAEPAA
jgi:hypothetical protein